MKKIYFLMGALAVSMLSACHNHDHEEKHTHGTEETAREAMRLAANKLPIKCKFVKKEETEVEQ